MSPPNQAPTQPPPPPTYTPPTPVKTQPASTTPPHPPPPQPPSTTTYTPPTPVKTQPASTTPPHPPPLHSTFTSAYTPPPPKFTPSSTSRSPKSSPPSSLTSLEILRYSLYLLNLLFSTLSLSMVAAKAKPQCDFFNEPICNILISLSAISLFVLLFTILCHSFTLCNLPFLLDKAEFVIFFFLAVLWLGIGIATVTQIRQSWYVGRTAAAGAFLAFLLSVASAALAFFQWKQGGDEEEQPAVYYEHDAQQQQHTSFAPGVAQHIQQQQQQQQAHVVGGSGVLPGQFVAQGAPYVQPGVDGQQWNHFAHSGVQGHGVQQHAASGTGPIPTQMPVMQHGPLDGVVVERDDVVRDATVSEMGGGGGE